MNGPLPRLRYPQAVLLLSFQPKEEPQLAEKQGVDYPPGEDYEITSTLPVRTSRLKLDRNSAKDEIAMNSHGLRLIRSGTLGMLPRELLDRMKAADILPERANAVGSLSDWEGSAEADKLIEVTWRVIADPTSSHVHKKYTMGQEGS